MQQLAATQEVEQNKGLFKKPLKGNLLCLLSKGIITALSTAQLCEHIVHSGTLEGSGGFHTLTVLLCYKSICWFPLGCSAFTKPYCKAGQGTHPYGAFPTALTSHANWLHFASWNPATRKIKVTSTLRLHNDNPQTFDHLKDFRRRSIPQTKNWHI